MQFVLIPDTPPCNPPMGIRYRGGLPPADSGTGSNCKFVCSKQNNTFIYRIAALRHEDFSLDLSPSNSR